MTRPASKTTRRPAAPAKKAAPVRAVKKSPDTPVPLAPPGHMVFLLDVSFHRRAEAQSAGVRWNPNLKAWVFVGKTLPPDLLPFQALPYSFEMLRQDHLNGVVRTASIPERNIVLRNHQVDAVRAIGQARRIGRKGYVLADDVGLGKTFSAWKALAQDPKLRRILIVAPLSVVAAWRLAIRWMGDHGKTVVIINYDRLQKLFEMPDDGKAPKKLSAKAGKGKAMAFDAVVWDESHRLKNPVSARSKFAVKLNAKADFLLWLSATAGENPLELSYLGPLLAQMTGSKAADMAEFEKWCAVQKLGIAREKFGKWVWSGEPQDTARVHQMLFGGAIPAGLRRRPEDIAGWPPVNRILSPVELDAESAYLYEMAWREFRDTVGLDNRGNRNPKTALAAQMRYRQKTSLLRIDATFDLALGLLENGQQVAISVAFQETLQALKEKFAAHKMAVGEIHGAMGAGEREQHRLDFQNGRVKVMLFTVEEGISLHQGEYNDVPRSEILHDIRWSAIQMTQIEGRCHRDGKFAQVYWMYAPDTIDDKIIQTVVVKMKNMKSMIGDDLSTVLAIEQALAGFAPKAFAG